MTRALNGAIDTAEIAGQFPITSRWILVSQEMIDQFGRGTLDPDPMHMDPEWARRNSPFGGTIAYGFLTVSLLSHLFNDARNGFAGAPYDSPGLVYLNFGFDRLRLVSPIRAGARVRGHFSVLNATQRTREGHAILKLGCRIEIEGQRAPALVAEWLTVGVSAAASLEAANG